MRLTSVTNGAQATTYAYDGIGRLVQIVRWNSGSVTSNNSYVWCGTEICAQLDNLFQLSAPEGETGTVPDLTRAYLPQGMEVYPGYYEVIDGFQDPGQSMYYVNDGLGSVHQLVDEDANLISQYYYDPYGDQRVYQEGSADSDFGFAGYFYDSSTGLTRVSPFTRGVEAADRRSIS